MSPAGSSTISATTAAEICARYEPSPVVAKIECGDLTPEQLVEVLVESGLYLDAIDFLAHALPKREAVWWACLGVRHALGADLPPKEFAALKAAVEWVLEPDEPKRRAAQAAGEAADFGTAAGCAALAVYGSGGSLTPPDLPEVPPEPFMTAKAVSGSLAMASVQGDPSTIPALQRELIELGWAIAAGRTVCPAVTKTTKQPPPVPSGPPKRR
jgi:hypothetical protein